MVVCQVSLQACIDMIEYPVKIHDISVQSLQFPNNSINTIITIFSI